TPVQQDPVTPTPEPEAPKESQGSSKNFRHPPKSLAPSQTAPHHCKAAHRRPLCPPLCPVAAWASIRTLPIPSPHPGTPAESVPSLRHPTFQGSPYLP